MPLITVEQQGFFAPGDRLNALAAQREAQNLRAEENARRQAEEERRILETGLQLEALRQQSEQRAMEEAAIRAALAEPTGNPMIDAYAAAGGANRQMIDLFGDLGRQPEQPTPFNFPEGSDAVIFGDRFIERPSPREPRPPPTLEVPTNVNGQVVNVPHALINTPDGWRLDPLASPEDIAADPEKKPTVRGDRFNPVTQKWEKVPAKVGESGSLEALDEGPLATPENIRLVEQYFDYDPDMGFVPVQGEGGTRFPGLGLLFPKVPALVEAPPEDQAALTAILSDPDVAQAHGINLEALAELGELFPPQPQSSPASVGESSNARSPKPEDSRKRETAPKAETPQFKKGDRVRQNGVIYEFDGKNWNEVNG